MIIQPFIRTNIKVVNIKNHIKTKYDFYIGRPSVLGNPYSHKKESIADIIVGTRDKSIDLYEKYFYDKIENNDILFISELNKMLDFYKENKELNICCWCSPKRCHGDIIKDYLEKEIKKVKI